MSRPCQLSSSAEVLRGVTWLFLSPGILPALPQLQLHLGMLNFGMEESGCFQHYSPQKQCDPSPAFPTGGFANRALLKLFEPIPGRASCYTLLSMSCLPALCCVGLEFHSPFDGCCVCSVTHMFTKGCGHPACCPTLRAGLPQDPCGVLWG